MSGKEQHREDQQYLHSLLHHLVVVPILVLTVMDMLHHVISGAKTGDPTVRIKTKISLLVTLTGLITWRISLPTYHNLE